MKTMKFIKGFFGLVLATSLFLACSTEDGDDGAIGPQGAQGPAGLNGEDGSDGQDGAVNAIFSDWIPSDFPETINSNFDQWSLTAPELTPEIRENGIILVYARQGPHVYPIPDTFYFSIQEHWDFRLFDVNDDLIAIRVRTIDGSNIGTPFLNEDFRYVLIPNDSQGTSKSQRPDFTKMSYKEVAAYFNIKD